MSILAYIVIAAGGVTLRWAWTGMTAADQKMAMVEKIATAPREEWESLNADFQCVSIDEHHKEIFFGRDPMALYSKRLRDYLHFEVAA